MYKEIKERVLHANKELVRHGLVTLTWGNVSEIDRDHGIVAIKPSGVDYKDMCVDDIVIVDLKGRVAEGSLKPSSDLPTHLYLYSLDSSIGSVAHTHSLNATSFAQAGVEICPLGTTHADHFRYAVPCTRKLTYSEIMSDYEYNTGVVIGETFQTKGLSYEDVKACLVHSHGPFVWGTTPVDALENAIVLDYVAKLNMQTHYLNADCEGMQEELLTKHYTRKHGKDAYYGQK